MSGLNSRSKEDLSSSGDEEEDDDEETFGALGELLRSQHQMRLEQIEGKTNTNIKPNEGALWDRAEHIAANRDMEGLLLKPWRFRTRDEEARIREKISKFRVFNHLSAQTIASIAKKVTLETYPPATPIYRQGEAIPCLMYILDGTVQIYNRHAHKETDENADDDNNDSDKKTKNNNKNDNNNNNNKTGGMASGIGGGGIQGTRYDAKYGGLEFILHRGDCLGEELIIGQPVNAQGEPLEDTIKPVQVAAFSAIAGSEEVAVMKIFDWEMPAQHWPMETNFVPTLFTTYFRLPPVQRSPQLIGYFTRQLRRTHRSYVATISADELDCIVRVATLVCLEPGEVLIQQSMSGQWFLVTNGLLNAHRKEITNSGFHHHHHHSNNNNNKTQRESFDDRDLSASERRYGPLVDVLKERSVFGELGVHKAPVTQATLIAGVENTEVIAVKNDVFDRILSSRSGAMFLGMEWKKLIEKSSRGEADLDDEFVLLTMMNTIRFFQQLPQSMVRHLSTVLTYEEFEEHDFIVRQGDANYDSFCLYIILSGEVGVHVMPPDQAPRFEAFRIGLVSGEGAGRAKESLNALKEMTLGSCVFVMKAGDSFGERAILAGNARTSTCIAVSSTVQCATLSRASYLKAIESMPQVAHSPETIALLLETPPQDRTAEHVSNLARAVKSLVTFQQIPTAVVHALCRYMVLMSFKAFDLMFAQGEPATYLGVILIGKAAVHSRNERANQDSALTDGMNGIQSRLQRMYGTIVANMGAGNVIGESILFLDNPVRANTVIAETDLQMLTLEFKHLKPYIPILSRNYYFENKALTASLRKPPKVRSQSDKDIILKALLNLSACKNLPLNAVKNMTNLVTFEEFIKGSVLATDGQNVDKFYIVLNGVVAAFGGGEAEHLEGLEDDEMSEPDELGDAMNASASGMGGGGGGGAASAAGGASSLGVSGNGTMGGGAGGARRKSGDESKYFEQLNSEREDDPDLLLEFGTPNERIFEGKAIGEMEIVMRTNYTRTLVAWGPLRLISLPRDVYEDQLLRFQPSEIYRTAVFLHESVDIFKEVEVGKLVPLVKLLLPRTYQRGHRIISAGEELTSLMIIRDGEARVTMAVPPGEHKREKWLRQGKEDGFSLQSETEQAVEEEEDGSVLSKFGGGRSLEVAILLTASVIGEDVVVERGGKPPRSAVNIISNSPRCSVLCLSIEEVVKLPPEILSSLERLCKHRTLSRCHRLTLQEKIRTKKNLNELARKPTAEYHVSEASVRNLANAPSSSITSQYFSAPFVLSSASTSSLSPPKKRNNLIPPVPLSPDSGARRPATVAAAAVRMSVDVENVNRPHTVTTYSRNNNSINNSWADPSSSASVPPVSSATSRSSSLFLPKKTILPKDEVVGEKKAQAVTISTVDEDMINSGSSSSALFRKKLKKLTPPNNKGETPPRPSTVTTDGARQGVSTSDPPRPATSLGNVRVPVFKMPSLDQRRLSKIGMSSELLSPLPSHLEHSDSFSSFGFNDRISSSSAGDDLPPRAKTSWGTRIVPITEDPWMADVVKEIDPATIPPPRNRSPSPKKQQQQQQQKGAKKKQNEDVEDETVPSRRRAGRISREVPHLEAAISIGVIRRVEERQKQKQKTATTLAPWAKANRVDRATVINGPDGRSRVISIQRFARNAKIMLRRPEEEV